MMIAHVDQEKNIKNVVVDLIMKQTILVTGGAGYIGSHTAWLLHQRGYQVVSIDRLEHGQTFTHPWATFIYGSLDDTALLKNIFEHYIFSGVMHFAASIEVSESCKNPSKYYYNNVVTTQKLLDVCRDFGVNNIIFSSSCAVYGAPQTDLLAEDHPKNPISPYGNTKYMVELMLKDYQQAYGINFVCLRYFNAAGAHSKIGLYEQHKPETHVIPLLLDALNNDTKFFVYGTDYDTPDGTAIRDYVHVLDIADAHLKALEYLITTGNSDIFNLGTGKGFSVLEICHQAQELLSKKGNIIYAERRIGDPKKLVANSLKAQQLLKWKPSYSFLNTIIKTAFEGYVLKKDTYNHQFSNTLNVKRIV